MTAVPRPAVRSRRRAHAMVLMTLVGFAALLIASPAPTMGNPDGFTSPAGCFCHSTNPDPSVSVVVVGLPQEYDPLMEYPLALSVSGGPSAPNGGFYLSADGGVFSDPGPHAKIVGDTVTHSDSDVRSWTVNWTAPAADYGTVTFSYFGNAVNGDGTANDADLWNSATYQVPENRAAPLIPTNLVLVVPESVSRGEEFTMSATLSDGQDRPVANADVVFSLRTTFGSLIMGNATTDMNGTAALNYTLAAEGEFLLDAKFRTAMGYEGAGSSEVLVVEKLGGDGPTPLLSGDFLAVVIVTLVLAGVWACYVFVAHQLREISKGGK